MTETSQNTSEMVVCPYCKQEIPQELQFCPYCMQRLNQAKIITPTQKNKKKIGLIIVISLVVIISFLLGIFLAFNKNDSNKSDTSPYTESNVKTETDLPLHSEKEENSLPATTKEDITNTTKNGSSSAIFPIQNTETQSSTTNKTNTLSNGNPNTKADTTEKITTEKHTQTNSSTATSSAPTNHITVSDMVSRWNSANARLNLWNYNLAGYSSSKNSDTCTISHTFSNNGANIDFTFSNDLDFYTLEITNIANLNTMYQLCRVSLAAVSENKYNDSAFNNFLSDDNWKEQGDQTQIKSGSFAEYYCTVTLKEEVHIDEWGLSYTRYSCTLKAVKNNS